MPKTPDEITFSIDEMMGIQALERIAADLPMSPGKPVAREFEYKRNGTQTLIAAMNIELGKITAVVIRGRKLILHILLMTYYSKIRALSSIIL